MAATETKLFGKEYNAHFGGRTYIENFYQNSDTASDIGDVRKCMLKTWYDILDKAGDLGDRLLDIGSGPTIYTAISPSRKVKEITLTDYTQDCLDELNKWLKRNSGAYDWGHWLNYAAKLEGNGVTKEDIESRIRSTVKEVLLCDVLQKNPLSPVVRPQFDVITSQLAINEACKNMDQYREAACNIAGLLKPGGKLFLVDSLSCTSYDVGGKIFHALPVTVGDVRAAYEAAGFEQIEFKDKISYSDVPSLTGVTDSAGTFFMHAVKKL